MSAAPALVVFSDLDGTLLDAESYSFEAARSSIDRLRALAIPLVLSSSKTEPEMLHLCRELEDPHPFIAENGCRVVIPPGEFSDAAPASTPERITLGRGRGQVLEVLAALRRDPEMRFEGFADWSVEEIAARTGLDRASAARAAERSGTEPLTWTGSADALRRFERALVQRGLRVVAGGRFLHVMDATDKADGVRLLLERYRSLHPDREILSIGLGDAPNDTDMLNAVDWPVIVRGARSGDVHLEAQARPLRTTRRGPEGWAEAMEILLRRFTSEPARRAAGRG